MTEPPAAAKVDYWEMTRQLMQRINRQIFEKLGQEVQTGPFKGMTVTEHPVWDDGNAGLKLLGAYEHELWPAIEYAIERKPSAVMNVGCAEGYYAVGLKRRLPTTPVYATDIDANSLQMCSDMAASNGVPMMLQVGCRTAEEMLLGCSNALYVLDVEGAELDLLDPLYCADLYTADIIVECHDFLKPVSLSLAQRFSGTHDVDFIEPQMPDVPRYQKLLDPLPMGTKLIALTEKRPMPTVWLSLMAQRR